MTTPYLPLRLARSQFLPVRGLQVHLQTWGSPATVTPRHLPLVMVHGWMDVGASFQFVVDALARAEGFERWVVAPDWRGFGSTTGPSADTYWFPDYLGDLDALLDALVPEGQVDLVGHSMGANVAMSYAGLRPQRIRRLVNLEGFGLPSTQPEQAPKRLLQWLDELKVQQRLRDYSSAEAVAERLSKNDPLLTPDKAEWLAPHWSRRGDDGRWHILGDPAHKRSNPILYQAPEIMQTWQRISAPVLWVEGDRTDVGKWWGTRYPRSEFESRLAVVPHVERVVLSPSGHMVHHDQPEALAAHLSRFLA